MTDFHILIAVFAIAAAAVIAVTCWLERTDVEVTS